MARRPLFSAIVMMATTFTVSIPMAACADDAKETKDKTETPARGLGEPTGARRMLKDQDLWLDEKRKAVLVDGEICLREGTLEMFACPKGTKEHESIIAVKCKPQYVHAALLAVGAKPGSPVKFDPEYKPATGQIVDIWILWKDAKGENQKIRAQEWIKQAKTGKAMAFNWVFGGSGFWKDDENKEHYYADGGDFICVSNFSSAMLDLPVESSNANAGLLFVADVEKIPPKGTHVRMMLVPRVEDKEVKVKVEEKK